MSNFTVSFHIRDGQRSSFDLRKALFFAFVYCFISSSDLLAQAPRHPFDNPRSEKLRSTLQQPCKLVTQSVTLRNTVQGLEKAFPIHLWLDRRVDAEQVVSIAIESRTVEEYLTALNKVTATETSYFEDIAYITPTGQSPQIDYSYWQIASANKLELAKKPSPELRWNTPQPISTIVKKYGDSIPYRFNSNDTIPWDIWAPAALPNASPAAQLTCLLSGFGLQANLDSKNVITAVQTTAPVDVTFAYRFQVSNANKEAFEKWKDAWPQCKMKHAQQGMNLLGPVAAHRDFYNQFIAKKIVGTNVNRTAKLKQLQASRFSLKLQGELRNIIDSLEKQLDIQFKPKPLDKLVADRRIQLEVENLTLDQLLDAIGKEAKVRFSRKEDVVEMYIDSFKE